MAEQKRIPISGDEAKEHDEISQRERAIQDVFSGFVSATTQEYTEVQARRQKMWRSLVTKYGLDSSKPHTIQTGPTGAFIQEELTLEEDPPVLDVPQRPN